MPLLARGSSVMRNLLRRERIDRDLDAEPVAVITDGFWHRCFAADPRAAIRADESRVPRRS